MGRHIQELVINYVVLALLMQTDNPLSSALDGLSSVNKLVMFRVLRKIIYGRVHVYRSSNNRKFPYFTFSVRLSICPIIILRS
jgi:hypothetical protein